MLTKFSPIWMHDKFQMVALLLTLLFFASLYVGFVL